MAMIRHGGRSGSSGGGGCPPPRDGKLRAVVQDGHGGQSEITTSTVSRRLALQVDIDASYSMQGSRMETAVHGLSSLLVVLRPTDLCGVSTFSTEVQNLHRVMQRSKVDAGKDASVPCVPVVSRSRLMIAMP